MTLRSIPLTALLLLATAAPAWGQRRLGVPGGDGLSARSQKAEYLADVIVGVKATMDAWSEAWSDDALDDLAETYSDDALLLVDGEPAVRGREGVAARLEAWMRTTGTGELFLQDIDGSGAMAMVYGAVHLGVPGGAGAPTTAEVLTVFVREGRHWRIRSQTFLLP